MPVRRHPHRHRGHEHGSARRCRGTRRGARRGPRAGLSALPGTGGGRHGAQRSDSGRRLGGTGGTAGPDGHDGGTVDPEVLPCGAVGGGGRAGPAAAAAGVGDPGRGHVERGAGVRGCLLRPAGGGPGGGPAVAAEGSAVGVRDAARAGAVVAGGDGGGELQRPRPPPGRAEPPGHVRGPRDGVGPNGVGPSGARRHSETRLRPGGAGSGARNRRAATGTCLRHDRSPRGAGARDGRHHRRSEPGHGGSPLGGRRGSHQPA